jgi:hypothetical protein
MKNFLAQIKNLVFGRENRVAAILSFLLACAVVISVILYFRIPKNAEADQTKDLERTLQKVSRIMVLPANEEPTLATVTDLSKLKDQPFFANAQEGDKVLIYPRSLKAILYSPSKDKIIEVSSVNLPPQAK